MLKQYEMGYRSVDLSEGFEEILRRRCIVPVYAKPFEMTTSRIEDLIWERIKNEQ